MNKKIKDITIDEVRKICKIQNHTCYECPFYNEDEGVEDYRLCLLDKPEFIPKSMLDKEIEVPDEELIELVFSASHTSHEAWLDLTNYMREHGFTSVSLH